MSSVKLKSNNGASLLNPHNTGSVHITYNKYWWNRFINPNGIFMSPNGSPNVFHSIFMNVAVLRISTYCCEEQIILKCLNLSRKVVKYINLKSSLLLVNISNLASM